MKILKLTLKGITTAMGFSLLSISNPALADNDLQFRPTKLQAKFYEIGFRNSTSGEFATVFANSSGTDVDLATEDGLNTAGKTASGRPHFRSSRFQSPGSRIGTAI